MIEIPQEFDLLPASTRKAGPGGSCGSASRAPASIHGAPLPMGLLAFSGGHEVDVRRFDPRAAMSAVGRPPPSIIDESVLDLRLGHRRVDGHTNRARDRLCLSRGMPVHLDETIPNESVHRRSGKSDEISLRRIRIFATKGPNGLVERPLRFDRELEEMIFDGT